MARYSTSDGVRGIEGEDGYGWLPATGGRKGWIRQEGPVRWELEKRRRSPGDTSDTGWYLYDNIVGGYFGESCGSRILDAVDVANTLIALATDGAPPTRGRDRG